MKIVSSFSERLSEAMGGMSVTELASKLGISKQSVSAYINGTRRPKQLALTAIAQILSVNPSWLMGYDVPKYRDDSNENSLERYGVMPIKRKKFPMLGEIACGVPIYACEERDSYVTSGTDINADFCLKATGDSMIGARIYDGDIVFIKQMDIVNNGEIAAVIIEDEATLKRVYYYPEKGKLILSAENPKYEPLVYVGEELNQIRILGKAVAFQSSVK